MLPTNADLLALRQELSLSGTADVRSAQFVRFVIRISERFNLDIPTEDYPLLATVHDCADYLSQRTHLG